MSNEKEEDVFTPFGPQQGEADPFAIDETAAAAVSDLDDFDPFQVGTPSPTKSKSVTESSKKSLDTKSPSSAASVTSRTSNALPPRLDVRFKVHEEVSSTAIVGEENEGSSEVVVEGTVLAQVTSSDAIKNSPFILVATSSTQEKVDFTPNKSFAQSYESTGSSTQVHVIKVPKSMLAFVKVGEYRVHETIHHMPMLLERKLTRSKEKLQVAIQVRSKLANPDDLTDFSIALGISEKVASDTIEVNVGNGEWNRMTRTVLWRLDRLPKGESLMVSARAKLTKQNAELDDSELHFPIMMRCKCNDQISSAQFQAVEASGYPATMSSATVERTYRIIHRLT